MVILRTRNKITDFLMILAWASPFNVGVGVSNINGTDFFSDTGCDLYLSPAHTVIWQHVQISNCISQQER